MCAYMHEDHAAQNSSVGLSLHQAAPSILLKKRTSLRKRWQSDRLHSSRTAPSPRRLAQPTAPLCHTPYVPPSVSVSEGLHSHSSCLVWLVGFMKFIAC